MKEPGVFAPDTSAAVLRKRGFSIVRCRGGWVSYGHQDSFSVGKQHATRVRADWFCLDVFWPSYKPGQAFPAAKTPRLLADMAKIGKVTK